MKRVLVICIVCMLLVGCSNVGKNEATENTASESEEKTVSESIDEKEEDVAKTEKTLIVFFSRAGENWDVGTIEKGNTEIVAEYIAEETGFDIFRIEPIEDYPSDYNEMLDVATKEREENARPEIKNEIENIDDYQTIILGYPIWWGDMPMIVYNFLESYNFSGKTIYPFDTHGGSGLANTVNAIKETAVGSDVKDGLAILGKDAQNDFEKVKPKIDEWIQDITG